MLFENLELFAWSDYLTPNCLFRAHLSDAPALLRTDLSSWRAEHDSLDPLPEETFLKAVRLLLEQLRLCDTQFDNPYHNRIHAGDVVNRVSKLLSLKRRVSPLIWQLFVLAALGHDLGHPGTPRRLDAKKVAAAELGADISNEAVSWLLTDAVLQQTGLNLGGRLFVRSLIIATTFGNPEVTPLGEWEPLIALADIAPDKPYRDWLNYQNGLVLAETTPAGSTLDPDQCLQDCLRFCEFTDARMRLAAKVTQVPTAWYENLQERFERLKAMQAGTNPLDLLFFQESLRSSAR